MSDLPLHFARCLSPCRTRVAPRYRPFQRDMSQKFPTGHNTKPYLNAFCHSHCCWSHARHSAECPTTTYRNSLPHVVHIKIDNLLINHLDPNPRMRAVVQDLYSTDPTQKACPRSWRLYGSHPATRAGSYRPRTCRNGRSILTGVIIVFSVIDIFPAIMGGFANTE